MSRETLSQLIRIYMQPVVACLVYMHVATILGIDGKAPINIIDAWYANLSDKLTTTTDMHLLCAHYDQQMYDIPTFHAVAEQNIMHLCDDKFVTLVIYREA